MAAAFVQPSPRAPHTMATGRIPLASNPNAANSPFRGLVPVSGKRTRAQVEMTKEVALGQPPAKKQVVAGDDGENAGARTLTRQSQAMRDAESRLLSRKPTNAPMTELNRRLAAARVRKLPAQQERQGQEPTNLSRKTDESLETIRQWQKHYKKAFPHYVFYFDSVPEEIRIKNSRLVQALGSKEEKFFSKSVTHVVTSRQIPSEDGTSTNDFQRDDVGPVAPRQQQKTIDPALLNRTQPLISNTALRRTTDLLDASLQSRSQVGLAYGQVLDARRGAAQTSDILIKSRQLGIKIWALEKLQRMMNVMYSTETDEQPAQPLSRSHATQNLTETSHKEVELQRMLRHEKVVGPADRDKTVAAQDMVQLRGYYIYVHDIDEKTRPTMVRDYPKVVDREQGKWPQFRLSSAGRCPFVEDPSYAKRVAAAGKREAEASRRHTADDTPVTRKQTATQQAILAERGVNLRRSPRKQVAEEKSKPLDPPKLPVSRHNSTDMPPLFGSAQANMRARPRYIGGEPVASGVQPSNITSAIRSRVISSTAISSTAPDARVGTSKELHALKRKVLERGANITSGQTIGSSYMNDVRAALNGDGQQRSRKRSAQDTLGNIYEDEEEERRPRKVVVTRRSKALAQKEAKPGYCENCRDKFDDFDEHILSKKHRKFALDPQNWTHLDQLLSKLVRQ